MSPSFFQVFLSKAWVILHWTHDVRIIKAPWFSPPISLRPWLWSRLFHDLAGEKRVTRKRREFPLRQSIGWQSLSKCAHFLGCQNKTRMFHREASEWHVTAKRKGFRVEKNKKSQRYLKNGAKHQNPNNSTILEREGWRYTATWLL